MDQLKLQIVASVSSYTGPQENLQKILDFLESPPGSSVILSIRGPNAKHERIANGGMIKVEMARKVQEMRIIPQPEKPFMVVGYQDKKFIGVHKNTSTQKVYATRFTLNERQFTNIPGTCNHKVLWQKSRHVFRENEEGVWIKERESHPIYVRCGAKNCQKDHNQGEFVPGEFTTCPYCEDVNISYSLPDEEELPIVEDHIDHIDPFEHINGYQSDESNTDDDSGEELPEEDLYPSGDWEEYSVTPFDSDTLKLTDDFKIPCHKVGRDIEKVRKKCLELGSIAFVTKLSKDGKRNNMAYIRKPGRSYNEYKQRIDMHIKANKDSKGYKIHVFKEN